MNTRPPLSLASLALLALVPSASGAAAPVVGGSLAWNQANVYNALPERTFLGHTTNPGLPSQGKSNGTALATAGATTVDPVGALVGGVTPASGRGVDQAFTFRFPAASGTFDRESRTLDVTTTGTLTYAQYPELTPTPPPAIALSGLRITLSGATGAVYADVAGPSGVDPAGPLFTLNATQAQILPLSGGRYLVANLVPTLAKVNVFGSAGQYAAGVAGPDRTPNTWGGFSLVVDTQAATAPAAVSREILKEVAVPQVFARVTLARRPFGTSRTIQVAVRRAGSNVILGEGWITGRRLVVSLPKGTVLSGRLVLRRLGSTARPRSAGITLANATTARVR